MSVGLRVDRIACTGHGLCAELLPEKIVLDEWGYPILDGKPVEPWLEALARRAARDCPVLALKLTEERDGEARGSRGSSRSAAQIRPTAGA